MGEEAIGKGGRGKTSNIGEGFREGDSKKGTSLKKVTSAETRYQRRVGEKRR